MRALPQPVVKATAEGVADHAFEALPDRKAIEAVRLKDGLELRIHHSGCAHYVLTFEFRAQTQEASSGRALIEEAKALLRRLEKADATHYGASYFKDALGRGLDRPSYEPGESIPVIEGYSWIAVSDRVDAEGRRWVLFDYDIAL